MWFGVCIAVAIELVPLEVSSIAVSLYLFIVNIVGGNLNLLLPWLQKSIGLQDSMIVLFPGAYCVAGVFFILAGLSWNVRYVKPVEPVSLDEQTSLIQHAQHQESITESQDIQQRLSNKRPAHSGHALLTSLSYTAAPI